MASGILTVDLVRDGQATPWGFRLHGGKDVGYPLSVQRVFLGTPSEGEIHRGDIILMIGNKDARNLTHQQATDIFRKAGNNLRLVVQRGRHGSISGGSTPISAPFGSAPLLNTSGGPITMYHFAASPSSTPPPPLTKPLPTTQFTENYRPYTPDSQMTDEDSQEYLVEKHRERQSIVNQAHRTFPLITPQAKPRHDLPTGSYLRFVNDPNWKNPQSNQAMANKVTESLIMAKLQDNMRSVTDSPVSSYSPGRTPTPESLPTSGPKIFHKQYNSPINLYSAEAITETLVGQASIQHNQTNTSVAEQPLPSPLIYSSMSIKRSPTYQLLHHQEWNDLKKSELKEHNAVENKVYSVPFGEGKFGHGKDIIHQSGSFKNLMANVAQSSV